MHRSIARHLPLITSRIEFHPSKAAGSQLVITPRINFDEEWGLLTSGPTGSIQLEDEGLDIMMEDNENDEEPGGSNNSMNKIPKPQGEPGCPNCGGYSIENELRGWSPDLLENVTVSLVLCLFPSLNSWQRFVKKAANEKLDTTQSYVKQKSATVTEICVLASLELYIYSLSNSLFFKAKKHYAIINKYENYWPIRDILKLHLKYTSETYQKQGEKFCKTIQNKAATKST